MYKRGERAPERNLLEHAVAAAPEAEAFEPEASEAWPLEYPITHASRERPGPAFAKARAASEERRLAHSPGELRTWLEQGAPSDDMGHGRT